VPQEIVIDVSANGDVTIEGKGFDGPECKKLTKELEEAVGVVTHTTIKPEYHRAPPMLRKAGR
jgi:hypothetical protein